MHSIYSQEAQQQQSGQLTEWQAKLTEWLAKLKEWLAHVVRLAQPSCSVLHNGQWASQGSVASVMYSWGEPPSDGCWQGSCGCRPAMMEAGLSKP